MNPLVAAPVVPRLGLVEAPSPLELAPELGAALGVPGLRLKRDDRIPTLHGGTKLRKLDVLLAAAPFAAAPAWLVAGAVGSGQVAAVVGVGRSLGRPVHAHVFRTPLGAHGEENLAFTASYAASVSGYRNQVDMAVRAPHVVLGLSGPRGAVVPLGATSPAGMLGMVLAGVEFAAQLADQERPDAIYVPCGSGGTAVGLAVGLAAAGVDIPVRAVAVLGRFLLPDLRVAHLRRQAEAAARAVGLTVQRSRLELIRSEVGGGYAHATPASGAAAARLVEAGIAGEPVYSGKALAALIADAAAGRTRRPCLWVTVRRPGLERREDWVSRLPPSLRGLPVVGDTPSMPSRRGLVLGLGAAAALVGTARLTGYPGAPGEVLGAAELAVIRAAGEALFRGATETQLDALPARVDRYLLTFPTELRLQVHGLCFAVEQNLPFAVGLRRFTSLSPEDRLLALERVAAIGGPGLLVARSLRDLLLIAWYQSPEAWAEIGYEGPMVDAAPRATSYDALRAPAGWAPFSEPR